MKQLLLILFCSTSLYCYEILSYADAIIDYIVFVDEEFLENLPGEKGGSGQVDLTTFDSLTKKTYAKCAGGSSINTMKGLALLGHSSKVIGRIGNDDDAKDYIESLHSFGIMPDFEQHDTYTGRVACLISPDGHRTMRNCIGDLVGFDDFTFEESDFDGIQLFHIEGYQIRNPTFLRELVSRAKEGGALISMDVGCHELVKNYKGEFLDLIAHDLDVIFMNGEEAEVLIGMTPKEACLEFSKQCNWAIVTCGEKGGYVASNGNVIHYEALDVELVDDTGAGDCFMAGFLHGVLTDQSLEQCAHLGALVASKIIQIVGAELPKDLVLLEEANVGDDHEIGIDLVTEDASDGVESCTGS